MQPAVEYVPRSQEVKADLEPNNKLPDYGSVVDEAPRPRLSFEDRAKSYQKIQYSEPFHTATPVTEFVNEPHVLDPIESNANKMKPQAQSSLREPLHFHDTYDNQVSPKESGTKGSSRGSPISATSATLSINSGMTSRKQHLPQSIIR
jgi:hypothetical protein